MGESPGTLVQALPIATDLTSRAKQAATSTMVSMGVGIYAATGTVGQARRTVTLGADASFAGLFIETRLAA